LFLINTSHSIVLVHVQEIVVIVKVLTGFFLYDCLFLSSKLDFLEIRFKCLFTFLLTFNGALLGIISAMSC
jgi:hypothetical protein